MISLFTPCLWVLLFVSVYVKLASLFLCLCLLFCSRNAEIINASYCMGAFTWVLSIQMCVLTPVKQALFSRSHLPVSEFVCWYYCFASTDVVWLFSSLNNPGLAKVHYIHNGISDNRIGTNREISRGFNFPLFNENLQCIRGGN